jgi:hypothetical protein
MLETTHRPVAKSTNLTTTAFSWKVLGGAVFAAATQSSTSSRRIPLPAAMLRLASAMR